MKNLLTSLLLCTGSLVYAQLPVLHIQIVSHNEPNDNLQNPLNYTLAKGKMLQMAAIVNSKNAKWNVQSSDGFTFGARTDQANTGTNIFSTLSNAPYNDNIEIDPRNKNFSGRNIADQWYLLDSLGANPTTHLGGCVAFYSPPYTLADIDWLQYRDTIHGLATPGTFKCSLITGAGSIPAHSNDLQDFGCFKPDTTTNFYQHNPAKNLWCIGVGCAPVLDSASDEQAIIDLIQSELDSIQSGLWPPNRFYVMRIMTNQREYGPLFFSKISRIIDSLNLIPTTQLKWATIGESFADFQAWQATSGLDYSQWQCGETLNSVAEAEQLQMGVYPNPASEILNFDLGENKIKEIRIIDMMGKCVKVESLDAISSTYQLDISELSPGIYFATEESSEGKVFSSRFLKQ